MHQLLVTRRGLFKGTAGAAILAGLAGILTTTTGCSSTTSDSASSSSTDTQYFKSDYEYTEDAEKKLSEDQHELYRQIVGEGTVLLKNEGNALPLSTSDGTITVFGNAGPQYLSGLDESFKDAGFQFDDACWEFYTNGTTNVTNWAVNENPWSDVESAGFLSSASGVAIVVLGRRGREASDNSSTAERDYLALSEEEKQMLNGVAELRRNGTFTKMIVLMTLTNTPSWEDGDWSDAVDSLVWIGSYDDAYFKRHQRSYTIDPLVEVLDGSFNPSGRMPDTLYKNNQLNPGLVNFGVIDADLSKLSDGKDDEVQHQIDKWKPSNDKGSHWRHNYVYAEGIYVGYRYYETRYEDQVLGAENVGDFDYSSYVAYPFGYGISYTTFAYSDLTAAESDDGFDISVKVTNTGDVAGKNAVTVYMQSPYTSYDEANGIEKAAVELVGYAKSSMIEPGANETVTVHVDKRQLACYDANAAKTYILDDGDYYFTVGNGSHEAVNNILAAKGKTTADGMTADGDSSLVYTWNNPSRDTEVFSTSAATGNKITNLFDDVDPNKNETMKELNSVTWMSRSDWAGTYPTEATSLVYTDEVADMAKPVQYEAGSGDTSSVATHEFGKTDSDLVLVDMRGKDYDDPDWEKLISKLTYEEMVSLIADDQTELDVIGKPNTTNADGSNGRSSVFSVSGLDGIPYPMTAWRAATFNTELNESVGKMIGENMLHAAGVEKKGVGLYGFSCNTHRVPYAGRNLEYYSEDPFLAGNSVAHESKGFVDKGGITYIKHFAVNDQEQFRHGVPSWANEQALREIYLKPFGMAIADGKANGVMSGFNRLGMYWTGASPKLLHDFAEGEEGYCGITLTDAFETDYMDTVDGLLNGTHAWLGGTGYKNTDAILLQDDYKNDPVIQDAVFSAVHRILYVNANSLAMNGLTHDYKFGSKGPEHPYADKQLMISGVPLADPAAGAFGATLTTDFYADGVFAMSIAVFGSGSSSQGTWTYDDNSGLAMKLDDGTALDVTFENGVFKWSQDIKSDLLGQLTGTDAISQYEFVTAANQIAGKSYAVPDQPTYTVTYSAENDKVTGTDPSSQTVKTGDTFTLPDNPYSGTYQQFVGWSVNGTTMQPGDEVKVSGYTDYAVVATWVDEALVTAETQDDYKFSFVQPDGVPMILYCNGNVRLQHYNQVCCNGTWEVSGTGAGTAQLTIKNESGAAVRASVEKDSIVYQQEGYYYDWGQPDVGYGSGIFRAIYTHRIPVSDFVDRYNEVFGTSYSDVSVTTGSATFAEVDDPTAASVALPW
ncbi:MAG: glycoside hydrolase family 3 C-terminal domain-containing protein [Tractidigestivibacter sp.]|jgi:beta-glucosidase|uniref:glycoside hydrolase family 3 C-terminal domain-containing protein n=1 Tax=Tractidigestivibacter sp. TaxID=2847320 RepID=UPI003D93FA43